MFLLLYRCIIVRVVLNAVPMLETVPVYHSLNVQFARFIVYHTSLDIYHQMVYLKNGDLFPVSNNFSSVYSPLISLSLNFSYFLFAQTQLASSPSATSNPEPRIVIWILPFHVHKTPNNTPNNGNRNIKHRPNRAPNSMVQGYSPSTRLYSGRWGRIRLWRGRRRSKRARYAPPVSH